RALRARGALRAARVHPRFIDERAARLIDAAARLQAGHHFGASTPAASGRQAGARVDAVDPLAVLAFGKTAQQDVAETAPDAPEGTVPVPAPMQGTIASIAGQDGGARAA